MSTRAGRQELPAADRERRRAARAGSDRQARERILSGIVPGDLAGYVVIRETWPHIASAHGGHRAPRSSLVTDRAEAESAAARAQAHADIDADEADCTTVYWVAEVRRAAPRPISGEEDR